MFERLWKWLTPLCNRCVSRAPGSRSPWNARLGLEVLEERTLPSAGLGLSDGKDLAASASSLVSLLPGPASHGSSQPVPAGSKPSGGANNGVPGWGLLGPPDHLGTSTGSAASALQTADSGFPAQIPWFQTNQPGSPATSPSRTSVSAPEFPAYLNAVSLSPTVSSQGAVLLPLPSQSPAPEPVTPVLSASAASLPAYLTANQPGTDGSGVRAWNPPPVPPTASVPAAVAGKADSPPDVLAVPPEKDEVFFAPWLGEEIRAGSVNQEEARADSVNPTAVSFVLRAAEEEGEQTAAVFAMRDPQTTPDEEEDPTLSDAVSWRAEAILLTIVSSVALAWQGACRTTDPSRGTPQPRGFRPPKGV
jgi:hypothetical protein